VLSVLISLAEQSRGPTAQKIDIVVQKILGAHFLHSNI